MPSGRGWGRCLLPAALAWAVAATAAEPPMRPYGGETPAPFSLSDVDGEPVALEGLRGRVVLLNFWASWCGPCVQELPSMQRLATRLADAPFELVAVNMGETPEAARAFLDGLGLDPAFTVVTDPDGVLVRDWNVFAYPSTFLLDPSGEAVRVRYGGAEWDAPEVIALIESLMPAEAIDGEAAAASRGVAEGAGSPGAAAPGSARPEAPGDAPPETIPRELATPAGPGAREPDLTPGPDGTVLLSWTEPAPGGGGALRASRLVDGAWTAPSTVAADPDRFVNWADFPSLAAFGEDRLAAWWPVVSGADPYAYDLHLALSADGGRSWGAPVVPHDDGTPTQHGFAAMAPWTDGRLFVAWLDGRVNALGADPDAPGPLPSSDMTLRSALVDADGRVAAPTLLDDRVCSCCGVDAVRAGDAVLVAYRDRSADEVRDVSLVRHERGRWSAPYPLHADGWRIEGCPVNGAALAADPDGGAVVAVWFTAADDAPAVLLARSDDGGRRFGEPVRIDGGRPLGRVDVALLDGGDAVASWLESTASGEALRYRRVRADGVAEASVTLARSARGRTIGFARSVAMADPPGADSVVFAWTQPAAAGPGGVRTAIVGFGAADASRQPDGSAARRPASSR